MSFIGSMLSLDSRASVHTGRTSIIRNRSSGLCRLDLRHIQGRRLLLFQLLVVPSMPLILMTSFTAWRLTWNSIHLHDLRRFSGSIEQQKSDEQALAALRHELLETVYVLAGIHQSGNLLTLQMNNNYNLNETSKRNLIGEVEQIRSEFWKINSSIACKTKSRGSQIPDICHDVITGYIDVIDDLMRTPEGLLIPGLSYQVHSYWHAARSLLVAEREFILNCLYGTISLALGDISTRPISRFVQSIALVDYNLADVLSMDPQLLDIYNPDDADYLIQQSNILLEIMTDAIHQNNSNVQTEWIETCNYFEHDIFRKMWKDIYSGLYSEGLQPTYYQSIALFVFYVCSLAIQLPIIIFIVENARTTGISIFSSVNMFSSKVKEIDKERRRTEMLLKEMLPKSIARKLLEGGHVEAYLFNNVTILFSDIADFNELSNSSEPMEVVNFLNDVYSFMDEKLEHYDVYKVETIGCVYMVASGLPVRNGDRHVTEIASMALDLIMESKFFIIAHLPGYRLKLRVGIHTGPCCAGVVGNKMPRYCLFGDTVNTASRMQSSGEAFKIHITNATHKILRSKNRFVMKQRGSISVKGKGNMLTYWLLSEKTNQTLGPTTMRPDFRLEAPREVWRDNN